MNANHNEARVAVITGTCIGHRRGNCTCTAPADGHRVALWRGAPRGSRLSPASWALTRWRVERCIDRAALERAAQRVQDELGGADILVNNGGVMLLGPFWYRRRAGLPPDDRGQPARRDHGHRAVSRPAPRWRGRHDQHLLGGGANRAAGNGVYAATEWGHRRLDGVAAPGAAARVRVRSSSQAP